MNFVQYYVLFIVCSGLLMGKSDAILQESYKHLADKAISAERQYELANSAMSFGLFENAAEIYESLFSAEDIQSPNINQDELRFSLIKAYIGSRNFDSAEPLLDQTPKVLQRDQYFLYNLITQYVLNYKLSKKDLLDLLKRNLKQIKVENLKDEDKAWYYYFRATEELIKGKKGDLKNSLFQAKAFSESDEERRAFFESLILRLDYNIHLPSLQTIRQLKKLLKANESKKQAYFYAYDYAYLLSLRDEKDQAIDVINDELLKGESVYSLYELDNLRLLKVVVLGVTSLSGRDLLFTLIQSSEDDLILDLSFRLLREYISRSNDVEFLNLSAFLNEQ